MSNYSVAIKEVSKQLSAKERVMLKDTTNCIKLDEATQLERVHIKPAYYAVLEIHNDKSDSPDYDNYIVVAEDGKKFITGSKSFWSSFTNIMAEMEDCDEEWGIEVYRVPSKNYKGKDFITCSIE